MSQANPVDASGLESEEDDRRMLENYIVETRQRLESKVEERRSNYRDNIVYPDEAFFVKLDSNFKKNSAFVKRLKNLTEAQRDGILKDMKTLNLTKFTSEIAAALVEAKLKMGDIALAVKVSSEMHQRYPDFNSQFLEAWTRALPKKPADLISLNLAKMRTDIRLFGELISSGIFTFKEGLLILSNLLTLLTSCDKETHTHIGVILSFSRHCGDDYAGLVSKKINSLAVKSGISLPRSDFLSPERQKNVRSLLKEYFKSVCTHVLRDHKALKNEERINRKMLESKGEVSNERKEKLEHLQVTFQKLSTSAQQLCDLLEDEEMPQLPAEVQDDLLDELGENNSGNIDVGNRFKNIPELEENSIWQDEDEKSFYEQLPALKELIPSILWSSGKESVKDSVTKDETAASAVVVDSMKEPTDQAILDEVLNLDSEVLPPDGDDETNPVDLLMEEDGNELGSDDESNPATVKDNAPANSSGRSQMNSQANKAMLDAFLSSLVTCVNRDMIDKAAINFCTNLNTKHNRQKLTKALFQVPRTRIDLLAFYARFCAALSPVIPTLAADLALLLKKDFLFQVRKKDQVYIESKIKTVRFIGEMVKFKLFSNHEALRCLKLLLNDFSHHHIEMATHLLETCGRYLYLSPESHLLCQALLEQMMRKKAFLNTDVAARYITMIENAYYFTKPTETLAVASRIIERPPLHEYIRKILYSDLARTNVERITRQIRALDWDDSEASGYAIKCLTAAWNVKFYNIRYMAGLLASLNQYQDWVIPKVIDGVLEDIRLLMEVTHPKFNQRRISMVRYLGELYNFKLIEFSVVLKELYSFITFGVYYEESDYVSDLDPPENVMRIKMVCQLLDTSAKYFNHVGDRKRKLDCFILFFHRYYWFKKSHPIFEGDRSFPMSIDNMVMESVFTLRTKFKFAKSYEEANRRVEELMLELKPKVLELMPQLDQVDGDIVNRQSETLRDANGDMMPIEEGDEDTADSDYLHDSDEDSDNYAKKPNEEIYLSEMEDADAEDDGAENCNIGEARDEPLNAGGQANNGLPISAEDDEFLKDFEKLMSESITSRGQDLARATVSDIVIPANKLNLAAKKVVKWNGIDDVDHNEELEEQASATVNLMVMTRRGNKPQLKAVEVPVDSDLAVRLRLKEAAEQKEKWELKKLTLLADERRELLEDESAKGSNHSASFTATVVNINRDGRRKKDFQAPSVPDADLVFGNK